LAETLALIRRNAEAEWQYRVATAISPLSTRIRNSYGKFLFDAGRLEDARTEYERSLAADTSTDAYDHLGNIYLTWQDLPRAERAFRSALRADTFDSDARFGLAKVLESTGRRADALIEYDKGLEMDPSNSAAKAAAARLRGNASPAALSPVNSPPSQRSN
jgi:Tfp pilus assembly protein PilF